MNRIAERLKDTPQGSRLYKIAALPRALAEALQTDRLYTALTDFDFMEVTLNELGVKALIDNYDWAYDPGILNSEDWTVGKTDNLRIIQDALRLSSDILERDKTQLAEQILSRLALCEVPEIQAMLKQAKQRQA